MNLNRKTLRLVDLRVRHFFQGQQMTDTMKLHRINSIEALVPERAGVKPFALADSDSGALQRS